jgi:hypothetical protein
MSDSPKKLSNFEKTLSEEDKKKIAERRKEYAQRGFVVLATIERRDDAAILHSRHEMPIGRISSKKFRREYMHDVEVFKVPDGFRRNPLIRSWTKETGQLFEILIDSRALSVKDHRRERDGEITI